MIRAGLKVAVITIVIVEAAVFSVSFYHNFMVENGKDMDVMDSIFSHSKIKSNQCGKLVIEIDIPDSETCKEFVNGPHFDAYEYMERFFKQ